MTKQPLLIDQISYHPLPVIGWRQWTDEGGKVYERRKEMCDVMECDKCGGLVEMWRDTEEWIECKRKNRWKHNSFGLVYGFCEKCPTAYHDGFDCMYVLDLSDQVK